MNKDDIIVLSLGLTIASVVLQIISGYKSIKENTAAIKSDLKL